MQGFAVSCKILQAIIDNYSDFNAGMNFATYIN